MSRHALFLVLWVGLAGHSCAQVIFRCGNTYQQQACEGGTPLNVEDARSAEQQAQALQRAQQDAALAQRWAPEAAPRPTGGRARSISSDARPKPASPAASAPQTPSCVRKARGRAPAVGGCRDQMVYVAPGSVPAKKAR